MTNEEAIERIKKRICCEQPVAHYCRDNCLHGISECEFAKAIYALVMQTPKKLRYERHANGNPVSDEAYCPTCDCLFNDRFNWECDYCPHCGQRLDWNIMHKEEEGRL